MSASRAGPCALVVTGLATLLSSLALPTTATASPFQVRTEGRVSDRNYANFRVGATSATNRAEMCLEVAPLKRLSFEACGTGATWFHSDAAPQFMHLRAHVQVASIKTRAGWLQPRIGAGVAELQVGEDDGGLYFGSTGPRGVETAGPEVGASARLLTPMWGGLELISQVDATVAYLPYAPQMLLPMEKVQPQVTFTLGFGF